MDALSSRLPGVHPARVILKRSAHSLTDSDSPAPLDEGAEVVCDGRGGELPVRQVEADGVAGVDEVAVGRSS
jgi:hypothetical protein